jgi:mycofactocin system FadH/OYE family oxidoreductase 2/mycofactocin system FadH/OYE family oxidoreductase 1
VTGLLDPVSFGSHSASNRVVFGPHVTNLGRGRALSDRHAAYYAERAAGGAGLVVVETASVHDSDWPYERAPLASECPPGWAEIARICRFHGALVLAAIGHSGGQGSSAYSQGALFAPSSIPDVVTREVPVAMEQSDVDAVVEGFGAASEMAVAAGCAGVEVNAGQRSLLRQFCSRLTNHRADDLGTDQSLFLRRVLESVRAGAGADAVVGLRWSADELAPWAGLVPETSAAMVATLVAGGGVDYVTVERGSAYGTGATVPDGHEPMGFNREAAAAVREALPASVAVVVQGSIVEPEMAAEVIESGQADLVEMTRALIADPALVRKVAAGDGHRVRPCILCNQACQVRDPRNPLVSCVVDPRAGHETVDPAPPESWWPTPSEPPEPMSSTKPRLLVVGGGPAGLECARVAAAGGLEVTVFEKSSFFGGMVSAACRAPGRQRLALFAKWLESECRAAGVELVAGHEVLLEELDSHPGPVVCCTGSRPGRRSYALGPLATVLAAADVLRSERLPGDVVPSPAVVWDPVGAPAGVGTAELLAGLGAAVTLVTPDFVAGEQLARSGDLAPANVRLRRAGVDIVRSSVVRSVEKSVVVVEDRFSGEVHSIEAAVLVDAGHRLPEDTLYKALSGFRDAGVAGDAVAPRTILEAVLEGRRAAAAALEGQRAAAAALDYGLDERAPGPATIAAAGQRGNGRRRRGRGRASPTPSRRYPLLFSPLALGPVVVPNRVVFSAHLTNYAVDNLASEQHAAYYAARAAGGAGLIITEEHSTHCSDWPYEKLIHGYLPEVVPTYRRVTDAVHRHGVPIFAQINHNGGQASSMYSRHPVWAPSPVADPLFREVPHAVDEGEIAEIVAGYVKVAEHCRAGGFDGVELQCSHSSIVRGFLSPATNLRTDSYGGSLEGRARLLLELLVAVRGAVGSDLAVGVRLCGDELIEDGTTIDDAVAVARLVEAQGCTDYINTSIGVATATLYMIEASMHIPPGYAGFIPSAIRDAVSLPVVGVGRFKDPLQAERALEQGSCDLVGVVRGQIADPDFAGKARGGQPESIRLCLSCNQECVGRMGLNRWLGCIENPAAGREAESAGAGQRAGPAGAGERSTGRTDGSYPPSRHVMVVGAGPAGLQAAISAARRGHLVTVLEREPEPGGQVRLAASVPNRAEFGDLVRNQLLECRQLSVDLQLGAAATAEAIISRRPDAVVVATGSRPRRPFWAEAALAEGIAVSDATEILAERNGDVPGRPPAEGRRVIVVDEVGFHQATSTAELLADRGCAVEIVSPAMVVGQDLGITLDLEGFQMRAAAKGIRQATDRVVVGAADGALLLLHHPTGEVERREVDHVVLAVPAEPDDELYFELRRRAPGLAVRRAGDCVAPRRADAAVIEGDRAGASC